MLKYYKSETLFCPQVRLWFGTVQNARLEISFSQNVERSAPTGTWPALLLRGLVNLNPILYLTLRADFSLWKTFNASW